MAKKGKPYGWCKKHGVIYEKATQVCEECRDEKITKNMMEVEVSPLP